MKKTLSPLGSHSLDLKDRAEWHLEKLKDFKAKTRNYKYHAYMRSQILKAISSLDNARFSLPSDFAA